MWDVRWHRAWGMGIKRERREKREVRDQKSEVRGQMIVGSTKSPLTPLYERGELVGSTSKVPLL